MDQLRKYAELAEFNERLRWIVVVFAAVSVSLLEALGAFLVYVLLGIVTGVDRALEIPILGNLLDLAPEVSRRTLLLWATTAIALFFVVRAIAVLARRYVESRVTENAGARLSSRLTRTYLSMPYAFHLERNSAELIRNAYSTVAQLVSEVFKPMVRIFAEGLIVLGILSILVVTAPLATVLVLVIVGPAAILLLRVVNPRLEALGRARQQDSTASLQALQQSLGGIRDIKVLGREDFFDREFERTRHRLAHTHYVRDVLRELPAVGLETLMVLFIAGLFGLAILVEGTAIEAVPLLGLFGYAALRLKPSLNTIVQSVNTLRFSKAGIDDVHTDLKLLEERRRTPGSAHVPARLPFEHEIHVDRVSLRYRNGATEALIDVDLRISRGESVGIIGPTGGGKTTLVNVILGLLEPTAGAVRVDGIDIHDSLPAWHENLGMVPQDLFLADDTLRRNIALGLKPHEIDEDLVNQAVSRAKLEDVVLGLPEGLDTLVGERGVRLSGGQRQRVAIARALYREPQVIVFDEGTSALDNRTEHEVLRSLEALRGDRTLITVAHRLSTVEDCDRVVALRGGRVVAAGRYKDVLPAAKVRAETRGNPDVAR